jgi:sugar O-acyltransferase (sialic acid O-acetyltransferase NeuD family)
MNKSQRLVVIGDSAFAEIAYEYFSVDTEYEVVAFAVEREYRQRDRLFGVPVVDFETLPATHPPQAHAFYAALVYSQRNELRRRLYGAAKAMGFRPASYVSPRAFVWRNAAVGEHAFIFENNVVQPFVTLGDDVVLWSGNHIGHHSTIGDHCFVASHVVVSGFCRVGHSCFLGVNAAVANNLTIGDRCTIGAGALILGDVGDDETVVGVHRRRKEPPLEPKA